MLLRTIGLLLLLSLAACRETILHGLSEQEANRVFVALARSGIESEKVLEGTSWAIAVQQDAVPQALTTLEDRRMLQADRTLPQGSGASMFQSREERQASVHHLLASQLEATLERFGGVVEARVHLYLQPVRPGGLSVPPHRQSASVLLVAAEVAAGTEREVQRLVAGATGLTEDAISVVFTTRANPVPTDALPSTHMALGAPNETVAAASVVLWERLRGEYRMFFAVALICLLSVSLVAARSVRLRKAERMLAKLRTPTNLGSFVPEAQSDAGRSIDEQVDPLGTSVLQSVSASELPGFGSTTGRVRMNGVYSSDSGRVR